MKIEWKKFSVCLIIPLLVGFLSYYLTKDSMTIYTSINKPNLSPPAIVFPIVWTILYLLMGIASYLIIQETDKDTELFFYFLQLFFNFMWSLIFFNKRNFFVSFIWLILLLVLVIITTYLFYKKNEVAGYLMLPYSLWCVFALYLNYMVYTLN